MSSSGSNTWSSRRTYTGLPGAASAALELPSPAHNTPNFHTRHSAFSAAGMAHDALMRQVLYLQSASVVRYHKRTMLKALVYRKGACKGAED